MLVLIKSSLYTCIIILFTLLVSKLYMHVTKLLKLDLFLNRSNL